MPAEDASWKNMMNTRSVQQQSIAHFLGNLFRSQTCVRIAQRRYVFGRYAQFVCDPSALAVALIQEPFKVTAGEMKIKRFFGEKVYEHIRVLNRLKKEDGEILEKADLYQHMIMLFLINYEYMLFSTGLNLSQKRKKFKRSAPYVAKVLRVCTARKIALQLEDEFFAIMYPRFFERYIKLFDSNRNKYREIEQHAKVILQGLMQGSGIRARVQSRTKSMFSVHEKIKKKNILPSQILDLIGLRVLVNNKDDCYRALEVILTHWSAHHARVKDYIAIPKDNGYQSIHVTGEFEGRYVEIQIRTHKMHHRAQYGQASHRLYKTAE